ncbi:MAG: hypothetical protein R3248_12830 [Candidatus Promineifilaceae bacterium]|nr:hypothetical protein [Candidatus Promineifilaceae bacterium]
MRQGRTYLPFLLLLLLIVAVPAAAQKPDFGVHIVVDGEEFGTKAVTALPENEHNEHTFDKLYVFPGLPLHFQPLVGDSKPGDTDYNGGRWETFTVYWLVDPVPLTSDTQLHDYAAEGKLEIHKGSFDGGPPDYFECPLLPVLE